MNRRQFSLALPVAGLLIGCDTDQKPSPTATLFNNAEVQEALKNLSAAIGDLETEVGNFENGNWREVVPEVDAAAANVRDAFDALRKELGTPDA